MKGQLALKGQSRPFCPIRDCKLRCDQHTCVCRPCPPWCPACRERKARLRARLRRIRWSRPQPVDTTFALPPRPPRQLRLFTKRPTNHEGSTTMKYRQGDVLIARIDAVPDGLKPVPKDKGRVILAYGEVTGHAHAVEGEVELLAADVAEMEERFLRVEAEAQVVHEEHDTIILPPGDYQVTRQREYSPEEIRQVAD